MGYINSAATVNIVGKLTPTGRKKMALGGSTIITKFSLGDSDANYNVVEGLNFGEVPEICGNNYGTITNNGGLDYQFRSRLLYTGSSTKKPVLNSTFNINDNYSDIGYKTINYSANTISHKIINKYNYNDSSTNLFYSLGLPINNSDNIKYSATTSVNGGYSDTSFSGFSNDNVLIIALDGGEYGELIDGKSIKIEIQTTASTYTIYSTYENKNNQLTDEDNRYVDISNNSSQFSKNTSLLFCDDIRKPNNDITKSWSTGYSSNKPFSLYKKELFNFKNDTNNNRVVDLSIGVAYLDKGLFVITEPSIVNSFDVNNTSTTITLNSVITTINQKITCIADRNEFGTSSNKTFINGSTPRITEIGLYDNSDDLIAIAKTNTTYLKPIDELMVFNLKIEY